MYSYNEVAVLLFNEYSALLPVEIKSSKKKPAKKKCEKCHRGISLRDIKCAYCGTMVT